MTNRKEITYPYNGQRVVKCRGCGAQMFWIKTDAGKFMPVTKDSGRPHWADCKKADDFKTPKPEPSLELEGEVKKARKPRASRKNNVGHWRELYGGLFASGEKNMGEEI